MNPVSTDNDLTFWGHLDVLRRVLWRSLGAVAGCAVLLLGLKDPLFRCILAPCRADFCTYRLLHLEAAPLHLVSTELAGQFQSHLIVVLEGGVLLASPFLLWQLFGFVAPALYARERRFALLILPITYLLFLMGLLFDYFLLFPVALRFLATYQVSDLVTNTITLASYVSTFTTMSLALGLVFELPVALWLLSRCGLVTATQLRRYRRHALIVLMLLAALVTPPDIFTMFLVSLPLYALYEVSIRVIRR
jgi:sec-independent protein translocase protein TatC